MRLTSSFFVAAAFALSVNSAALDRRSVSVPVQFCIDSINTVSFQIDVVTASLENFVASAGYPGVLALNNQAQTLETNLKKAVNDCCIYTGTVTVEEVDAVLSTSSSVIPNAVAALALVKSKKSQFNQVRLSINIVKTSLANLNTETSKLYNCMLSVATAQHFSYLQIIHEYIFQLDVAFADARGAYATTSTVEL
ncbi:hypothetical protein BDF21DRAFT_472892 [Thamnidium elegans]|nr:hypothetical protein BDF21DRAFT_472892 [Thamnidium elegans]